MRDPVPTQFPTTASPSSVDQLPILRWRHVSLSHYAFRNTPHLSNHSGSNVLYVTTEAGGIVAVDPVTGNILGGININIPTQIIGFRSSPVAEKSYQTNDEIIFTGGIYAHLWSAKRKAFALMWNTSLVDTFYSTPYADCAHSGLIFSGSGNKYSNAYALNCSTGQIVWKKSLDGIAVTSPAKTSDLIVFGTRVSLTKPGISSVNDGVLVALHARNGSIAWRFAPAPHSSFLAQPVSFVTQSATKDKDPSYRIIGLMTSANKHIVYLLDALNRKIIWEFSTPTRLFITPTVGPLCDEQWTQQMWKRTGGDDKPLGLNWEGNKSLNLRLVYVPCSDGYLYAISVQTGLLVWDYYIDHVANETPVLGPDSSFMLYVIAKQGYTLQGLDRRNGKLLWEWQPASTSSLVLLAAPVVDTNNFVYLPLPDGDVVSLNGNYRINQQQNDNVATASPSPQPSIAVPVALTSKLSTSPPSFPPTMSTLTHQFTPQTKSANIFTEMVAIIILVFILLVFLLRRYVRSRLSIQSKDTESYVGYSSSYLHIPYTICTFILQYICKILSCSIPFSYSRVHIEEQPEDVSSTISPSFSRLVSSIASSFSTYSSAQHITTNQHNVLETLNPLGWRHHHHNNHHNHQMNCMNHSHDDSRKSKDDTWTNISDAEEEI